MGMYTELILGCALKKETPNEIIDALTYLFATLEEQKDYGVPINLPVGDRINWMFNSGGSYYFGAPSGQRLMQFDDISKEWRLHARFNIKNYSNEIENFINWIKPWVKQGSGKREMWAIVIYEEASEPTIYYLHEK